jgi:hypothetical protein
MADDAFLAKPSVDRGVALSARTSSRITSLTDA